MIVIGVVFSMSFVCVASSLHMALEARVTRMQRGCDALDALGSALESFDIMYETSLAYVGLTLMALMCFCICVCFGSRVRGPRPH